MGHVLGYKSPKGAVSITNYKERIRLRWRYQGKRYSVSLGPYDKINLKSAKRIVLQIELDMANGQFDLTLCKYSGKLNKSQEEPEKTHTIVEYFEKWVKEYKQMNCDQNVDYFHLRNTLRKWGVFDQETILTKLNQETFGAKTYNNRLSILKNFSKWLVK